MSDSDANCAQGHLFLAVPSRLRILTAASAVLAALMYNTTLAAQEISQSDIKGGSEQFLIPPNITQEQSDAFRKQIIEYVNSLVSCSKKITIGCNSVNQEIIDLLNIRENSSNSIEGYDTSALRKMIGDKILEIASSTGVFRENFNDVGLYPCSEYLRPAAIALDVESQRIQESGTVLEAVGAAFAVADFEIPGLILTYAGDYVDRLGLRTGLLQEFLPSCSLSTLSGLSAAGGGITLGDPDNTSFFYGITIGGGSIAGAGAGGDPAYAGGGVTSIAVGNGAATYSLFAGAMGEQASATGERSLAVGAFSEANGFGATAIGSNAAAIGRGSSAFGYAASANGIAATAVGSNANANGDGATAVGPQSFAGSQGSVALGFLSFANGHGSTGVGFAVAAYGEGSIAMGLHAQANGKGAMAIGYDAVAGDGASNAVAVGREAQALGVSSIAIGTNAAALTESGIAIGTDAIAQQGAAVAIGLANTASGNGAVAIGDPNFATGQGAVAVGAGNVALGNGSLAIGLENSAIGDSALALGDSGSAQGIGAIAIGQGTGASGHGATAIGTEATALFVNSTAIGSGAVTTRENQVAIGSSRNTYSMPGLGSPMSMASQIGPLALVTTDSSGNLGSDGGLLARNVIENRQGVALGIAMTNPDLVAGETSGVSVNWGNYQGATAFSLSGATVVANDMLGEQQGGRIAITASLGVATAYREPNFRIRNKSRIGARVGGQFTW
ncbi:hypothetical protein [Qipengyuania oceanensis]|uniref:Trimeric autotransporter adhesin YadA-like head domain-containing protein n=1 Tax=Qipengyuania oceanensis TaxID=1463597 RepID=A0A844YI82_9SPHN|nr:hypothetical protein [Qipengyuania oceanensis]MXO63841.1 hypothetical protein [Qipengyuania oceanensis]